MSPLDLHVLGTPPAFVLSQDQTLVFNPSMSSAGLPASNTKLFGIFAVFRLASSPSGFRLPVPPLNGSFLLARFSSVSFSRFGPLPVRQLVENNRNKTPCQAVFEKNFEKK